MNKEFNFVNIVEANNKIKAIQQLDHKDEQGLLNVVEIHQNNENTEIKLSNTKCMNIIKSNQLLYIDSAVYKSILAELCSSHLHIKDEKIHLNSMNKVKIYPNKISTKFFQFKLNTNEKEFYFAASSQKNDPLSPYCQHFQWFRNIIIARLQCMGIKVPQAKQSKQQRNNNVKRNEIVYIQGQILKKSKYLKQWVKRYATISPSGFYSFKDSKDTNYSYLIKSSTMSEIWTRFELIQNNEFLVIKVMHGQREKAQFGVPLCCLRERIETNNWLYQFYRIMQQGNGNKLL